MSTIDSSKACAIGVSGFSLFVPRFRVPLKAWCQWTGSSWSKVEKNVGRSFRVAGPQESIYTMAANAAIRLIRRYEVDPREIGYLALDSVPSARYPISLGSTSYLRIKRSAALAAMV